MGKQSHSTTTTYGNTTTTNPYVTSTTNNSGTTSAFNKNTALNSVYDFVNKNIETMLDEYLNPNINSQTNQAKLNAFNSTLQSEATKNFENNIINPLSNRNMVRSSQATDMYNNLSDSVENSLASYVNELISASQDNTAEMINNLLKAYMQGYDVISDSQEQSLKTSAGNSTTNTNSNSSNAALDSSEDIMKILSSIASLLGSSSSV